LGVGCRRNNRFGCILERVDGKLVAPFDEIDIRVALRDTA